MQAEETQLVDDAWDRKGHDIALSSNGLYAFHHHSSVRRDCALGRGRNHELGVIRLFSRWAHGRYHHLGRK